MREIKKFHFTFILFIFQLNLFAYNSIEFQIQVPQRGGMNIMGFNPLEDFLRFNDDLEKIANAMMGKSKLLQT
jgi:hypothetical protein